MLHWVGGIATGLYRCNTRILYMFKNEPKGRFVQQQALQHILWQSAVQVVQYMYIRPMDRTRKMQEFKTTSEKVKICLLSLIASPQGAATAVHW